MAPSTRFRILLAAAVLSCACDSPSPTLPTPPVSNPPPASPAPQPPPVPIVLRGDVVDENGQPVPAAVLHVQFFGSQPSISAVTDANGAFEVTIVQPSQRGFTVTVQTSGYEPSVPWYWISDVHRMFIRLYPVTRVSAGDTVQLSIGSGAYCGLEYEFTCRRVRIRSALRGVLMVEVTSAVPDDLAAFRSLYVVIPPLQYPVTSNSLSVPIQAGGEIAIDVLAWWGLDQPKPFMLKTSLNPSR